MYLSILRWRTMPSFFLAIGFFGILCSSSFSAGEDALSSNGTLSEGQTLISQNQDFVLGFFSPAPSKNWFLGIWYKKTPDVVVWVANRDNPIRDSRGVVLKVARNQASVVSRDGSIVWYSNSSTEAVNPILKLLDTGNLVLTDNDKEPYSYIWQSFDYLVDTRLPGMLMVHSPDAREDKYLTSWKSLRSPARGDFNYEIENKGLAQMMITRKNVKVYRSGMWNGVYVNVPTFYNTVYKGHMVIQNNVTTYTDPYNSSILTRLVLEESGKLYRYTMDREKEKWNLVYVIPKDPCDDYAKCGPNGICRIEGVPICGCLDGFTPMFQKNWDFQDWSDGCTRVKPLSCMNGDGFLEVKGVKYPDMVRFWLNKTMSMSECRDECSRQCNCTSFAQAYINNGGRGCLMWFGDLIDIRVLPGADKNQNIYIRLPISELESILKSDKKKKRVAKFIAISVPMGILLTILACGVIVLMARRKRRERKNEDLELPLFSFATITAATDNFSEERIIGEGGFGSVYKGKLSEDEEIAVKRLSGNSSQGLEEFQNEIILFSKLQHNNLVRLLGCCIKGEERMLIYEYLQNGSLDYLIFDQNKKAHLTWPNRFEIILGIARGLLYLHQDSRLKIIHRELKTSNILLDENLNPKISDFGLARNFRGDQNMARTRRVIGTYGYMAPEYALYGKFSVKSDVFSFGVMILEIAGGKKNRSFHHHDHDHSLLGHAWLLWKENKVLELMDECLRHTFVESQVKRCIQVGLLCTQKLSEDRPTMASVVFMLGCEDAVVPEPKEPGFFIGNVDNTEIGMESVRGTITMIELEAR